MFRFSKSLLLGTAFFMLCPVLGEARGKSSDVEKLQGTWLADLEPGSQGRLVLDGSRLLYTLVRGSSETVIWDGNFAVNEKADPKEMDWTPLRRNTPSPPASLAIYRLEGNLLLVIGSTEGARPTAFFSGGGKAVPKTVIFRRIKTATRRTSRRAGPADDVATP